MLSTAQGGGDEIGRINRISAHTRKADDLPPCIQHICILRRHVACLWHRKDFGGDRWCSDSSRHYEEVLGGGNDVLNCDQVAGI